MQVDIQSIGHQRPGVPPRERVSIRDNGVGINPAGLVKLFTPFERLEAAYGPIKGTGLGLTISKQLVEAMGGVIGVESTEGVGTVFWVEFAASPAGVDGVAGGQLLGNRPILSFP